MLNITGQNFIAGQRSSAGSKFVLSYDAATDEALPYQFAQATPEEIDQAAQAAALAYPAFRQTTPEQRAVFLETIASEIDARLMTSLLQQSVKKLPYQKRVFAVNVGGPQVNYAYLLKYYAVVTI